jgi:hypothetical protein
MSADKPKTGTEAAPASGTASAAPAPAPAAGTSLPLVTTINEAVAAKGTKVRVRGTAQREKGGDVLQVEQMSIACVGATFSDAVIGTTAEATGTLEVGDAFTTAPAPGSGPVRQGKPAGAKQWRLSGCTIP